MNTSQEGVTSMGEESVKVGSSYQALLSTGLTTCKSVFNQNFKGAEDWLNNTVSEANQTGLKNTNIFYISSLGERSISQRLQITQAFRDVSEKTSFALLIGKLVFLKKQLLGENVAVKKTQQSLKQSKPRSAEKAQTTTLLGPSVEKKEPEEGSSVKAQFVESGYPSKNKKKQNKEEQPIVDKDGSSKSKAKSSTSKAGKNKSSKKQ